jgi:hydroxypyruvate isomerase
MRWTVSRDIPFTFDCTAAALVGRPGGCHNAADPRARDDCLADVRGELRMMEQIDCRELIMMAGDVVSGLTPQGQHDTSVESLKPAADLAARQGVTILLENVDLCYDLFHAQISGGHLIAT